MIAFEDSIRRHYRQLPVDVDVVASLKACSTDDQSLDEGEHGGVHISLGRSLIRRLPEDEDFGGTLMLL